MHLLPWNTKALSRKCSCFYLVPFFFFEPKRNNSKFRCHPTSFDPQKFGGHCRRRRLCQSPPLPLYFERRYACRAVREITNSHLASRRGTLRKICTASFGNTPARQLRVFGAGRAGAYARSTSRCRFLSVKLCKSNAIKPSLDYVSQTSKNI